MTGNPAARRIADETLGLFSDLFRPFAEERFREAYGADWRIDLGFKSRSGIESHVRSVSDPAELLSHLANTRDFDRAFRSSARHSAGSIPSKARDLRDLRNDFAHHARAWEAVDAWRTVDGVRWILGVFGLLDADSEHRLGELEAEAAAVIAGDRSIRLSALRADYLESILSRTASLDLGGISPTVGASMVRIRLEDVYVEPSFGRVELGYGRAAREKPTRSRTHEVGAELGESSAFSELIAEGHIVVLGGPGSGKSSLVRHVARQFALADPSLPTRTPIVLTAPAIADAIRITPGMSLRRFIGTRASERFGELLEHELDLGRALVLIDGLDEIVDEKPRSDVTQAVGDFCADFPDIQVVVTSRPTGFRRPSSWSGFVVVAIEPFDDERIKQFVLRWSPVLAGGEGTEFAPDDRADRLLADLASAPGARDLASTPLLLTILVLLWQRVTSLPQRRVELYAAATLTLLRDWPARRLGRGFDERRVLAMLQPIAAEMIATGVGTIGERDLLDRWSDYVRVEEGLEGSSARERADEILKSIEELTGFFVEQTIEAGERRYGFLHRTFAEYLAARFFAERWDAGELDLGRYLHRGSWIEVVNLMVDHVGARGQPAATNIVRDVMRTEAVAERHLARTLRACLGFLANGVLVQPALRDDLIGRALVVYLDPDMEFVCFDIAHLLMRIRDVQPLGPEQTRLRTALSDPPLVDAKKAWLSFLLDPSSDDALRRLMLTATVLVTHGSGDPLYIALHSMPGSDGTDQDRWALVWGKVWRPIDDGLAERLTRLGAPRATAKEVVRGTGWLDDAVEPWLLDRTSLDELDVEDVLKATAIPKLVPILDDLDERQAWHDARAEDIQAYWERADALSPEVADRSWYWAQRLEPGPGRDAWSGLALAISFGGNPKARQIALVTYLSLPIADDLEPADIILAATLGDPTAARAIPILLSLTTDTPSARLVELAHDFAINHPDAVTRGLARRALLVIGDVMSPFALLAGPEIVLPPDSWADRWLDDTEAVVTAILRLDVPRLAAEDQIALGEVMWRIIEVSAWPPQRELSGGEAWCQSPMIEAVARKAVLAERPETRAWAGLLLRALDRRETASEEITVLLGDADERVRLSGWLAITEVDLREPEWLDLAILPLFGEGSPSDMEQFAVELRAHLTQDALADLALVAEAYLDDHPGQMPAQSFAAILLM